VRKPGERRRAGTNVRREPDVGAVAAALSRPGIDSRVWSCYATVCVVHDDGSMDVDDPDAVVISPDGVDVDVMLEPYLVPATCRYGLQAGVATILAPVRPGDMVLVEFPGGDMAAVPQIVKVCGGAHTRLPLEQDGKPIFRNDRLSIHARGVPVEIRTDGGAKLTLGADGSVVVESGDVRLVGPDADQHLLLGDAYRDAQAQLDDATLGLQQQFALLAAAAVGPLAAFKPMFLAIQQLYAAFEAKASTFLSASARTK
jgi:hypothetical protein